MASHHQRMEEALHQARSGLFNEARQSLERILKHHPDDADAIGTLATVLSGLGRHEEALRHAKRAVSLLPHHAGWLFNYGVLSMQAGETDRAVELFNKALLFEPEYADARSNLLDLLFRENRLSEMERAARKGLATAPEDARIALGHAAALRGLARAPEALAPMRAALESQPRHLPLLSMVAFTLNYAPGTSSQEALEAHRAYGVGALEAMGPGLGPARTQPDPERRLRIGVLSGEIVTHPVAWFLEPALRGVDRDRFETLLYYTGGREDATTERLRSHASAFANVSDLDLDALDRRIRDDRIDVLLELTGHTAYHRLPVLARRPAPVQVNWLGYPNTTGLAQTDWRIVDSLTDPPGAEARAVERLLRLDPCFLCYGPSRDLPDVKPAARGARPVTFASFNYLGKVNDAVIDLWSRLLREVDGSRLVLKDDALREKETREAILRRFVERGIAGERLTMVPKNPSHREHLLMYNDVDVALDTFPYNGTTTTCEALLMGTPVVTLEGDRHAGRVGVSILTNVGLGELIARDEDDYVRIAAGLCEDAERLRRWRTTMRGMLLSSPLCDEAAFARRFGEALRAMWRGWCEAQMGRG